MLDNSSVYRRMVGAEGFTTVVQELSLVEGGRFAFEMTAPDQTSCLMTGAYKQIQSPTKLVFEMIDHCNIGLPEGVTPQLTPTLVTVDIVETGEHSVVMISHTSLEETYSPLATMSWVQSLSKLAEGLLK